MSSEDKYKLVYLDCRALGEPIRLLFKYVGVEFEDVRIPLDKITEAHSYGYGQVPVLFVNGKQLTQSLSILRYLAKKFNLIPSDDFLAAKCDEIAEFVTELRLELRKLFKEGDDEKKKEIMEDLNGVQIPKYYKILNELVGEREGEFIGGSGETNLSWVDLLLASWLDIFSMTIADVLSDYPALKKLKDSVFSIPVLEEYIRTRPSAFI